jgi:hypothetical protein
MELFDQRPESMDTEHLSDVRQAIYRSHGVVVFGFRQLRVDVGMWRLGTQEQRSVQSWWSTPWVHIEAGMAIMSEKPTLVVREHGVAEGIFDRRNWADCIIGAELSKPPESPPVRQWLPGFTPNP